MCTDMTLDEARDWLRRRLDEGARCPCCQQRAQVYRRKLTSSMIETLKQVYVRQHGLDDWEASDWVYLPDIPQKARDFSTTAFFGLAEGTRLAILIGGGTGYWRVTDRGEAFLRGVLTVPKYACIYDGRRLRYDGDPVGVRDVAPRFSLNELLEAARVG